MVALAVALGLAIGWFLVRALWPAELRTGTAALRAVLAFGVGAGAVSLLDYVGLWLFGGASPMALVGAELALLPVLAWLGHRPAAAAAVSAAAAPLRRGAGVMFAVAALAAVAVFVLAALREPHGSADALSIWNLRARHLFGAGAAWRDAVANSPHADYPLLLPCTIARLWRYAGAAGQVAPAAVALLFPLATVALLVAVLRSLRGPLAGLLAGAALLACPAFVATAPMQYADLVLAFFVLATLAVLAVHDHHGRPGVRLAVLAGACLGFAVWTKNEGALFAIVLLLARAVAVRAHGWRCTRRELGALLLGAAPGIAGWWSVKLLVAPPNDLVAQVAAGKAADRIADPARWLEIARAFATELWNLGPAMLAVVLVWALLNRQRRLRLPLAVAVLVLAGDALVYLMASHNLSWHLATSLQRLLLQVLPLVLLGVFAASRAAAPPTTSSS